jgi:energy-coupling factor transporter ATP-binding protein EcfA2
MLELKDVSFAYPASKRTILSSLDMSAAPGKVTALMGANGSGKSTLARLVTGILTPDSGEIRIDGMAAEEGPSTLGNLVGMVRQDPRDQLIAGIVDEEVAFGPENLALPREEIRGRVTEALATVGLAGCESRTPGELSAGQQQRLAIAGILAMRPAYLIFDESASMLDPRARQEFYRLCRELAENGYGVLTITHFAEEAFLADTLLCLENGRLSDQGAPAELFPRHPELGRPFIPALADALAARGIVLPGGITDIPQLGAELIRLLIGESA